MKVKELIKELEKYDEELEVHTKERYSEGMKPITEVHEKYVSLSDKIIYIS